MFPGLGGGLNPKKMQAMMKQLGMSQEDIDASRVIIEKRDGSQLVINDPSVQKITMQGQESLQITGEMTEEAGEAFSEEDVKTVAEKTDKTLDEAKMALEGSNGDLADAIMKLSE